MTEKSAGGPPADLTPPSPTTVRDIPGNSRAKLLFAASLLLIAFNIRSPVSSIGPVLPEAVAGTGLTPFLAGVLTTIPTLCFGFFGPLAPALARRFGVERTIVFAITGIAGGCLLRGVPNGASLLLGQTIACIAIGMINVLLPSLMKRDFASRAALMTGLYTTVFCLGAALAAGLTAPLESRFGSWSAALAFWSLPALIALVAWLPHARARQPIALRSPGVGRSLLRNSLAWQVTLFMGLQSSLAYIVFAWLAPMLRERGLDPIDAGFALSLSILSQAGASLVAPSLATRRPDQSLVAAAGCILGTISLVGCFFAPLPTIWMWTIALGISQGALISLALTMIVLRSPDSETTAKLSGMAQGIGYILAGGGPFAASLIRDWSGGWHGVAALGVGLGIAATCFGYLAGRARQVGGGIG